MGLVQKRLCSFLRSHASGNRETAAEGAKNTGVSYPASNQPLITSEGESQEQASSSVPTGKGQTDMKSSSLEASPATRAKIPYFWLARCKIVA